jgi:5-methyltetrahydropteroyltriglutamate--homocysteine methyltransferase
MCYSEFNDIIQSIADMDAEAITIETSCSWMDLLDAFVDFKYPNEIGLGVYYIHSPREPSSDEMLELLEKALKLLPARNLSLNTYCGLKTRNWPGNRSAMRNIIDTTSHLPQTSKAAEA